MDVLSELFARHDLVKEMGGELFEPPAGTGERFVWRFDRPLALDEQVALSVAELDFNVQGERRCRVDGCWYATRVHAAQHLSEQGWRLQEAANYMRSLPEIEYPFTT